jgi:hypothetical protein
MEDLLLFSRELATGHPPYYRCILHYFLLCVRETRNVCFPFDDTLYCQTVQPLSSLGQFANATKVPEYPPPPHR